MATRQPVKSKSDLPPGLSQPALRALDGAGITQLKQITKYTEADLLKLHGMGPKGTRIIGEALKAKGLSFADSSKAKKSK